MFLINEASDVIVSASLDSLLHIYLEVNPYYRYFNSQYRYMTFFSSKNHSYFDTLISTICHANFIVLILKFCESSYGRAFMLHIKLVSCGCRQIFSWYLDCTSFFLLLLFVHKLKTKLCIWFVDKNSSTKLDQYLASCFWPFDWYCLLSRLIQCVIWIRLCFYCSLSYKLSVAQYQFSGSLGKLMSTRFDNSKFRNIFIWVS